MFDYIGRQQQSPLVAERLVRKLAATCDEYATLCASGHVPGTASPDLGKDYRVTAFKSWVVIFRIITDGIEVMRVVHGSRDFPNWSVRI